MSLFAWEAKTYRIKNKDGTNEIRSESDFVHEQDVVIALEKDETKGRKVVLKEVTPIRKGGNKASIPEGLVLLVPGCPLLPPRLSQALNDAELVSDYTIMSFFDAMLYEPKYVDMLSFCCRSVFSLKEAEEGEFRIEQNNIEKTKGRGEERILSTGMGDGTRREEPVWDEPEEGTNPISVPVNQPWKQVDERERERSGLPVRLLTYRLLPRLSFGRRVDILSEGRMEAWSDPVPPPLLLHTERKVCDYLLRKLIPEAVNRRMTKSSSVSFKKEYKMGDSSVLLATFDMSDDSPYLLSGRKDGETKEEERERVRNNIMTDLIRRRRDKSLLSDYLKLARATPPSPQETLQIQPHFFPFMNHAESEKVQTTTLESPSLKPYASQIFIRARKLINKGQELQFNYAGTTSADEDETFEADLYDFSTYKEKESAEQEAGQDAEPNPNLADDETREGFLPVDLPYVNLSDVCQIQGV